MDLSSKRRALKSYLWRKYRHDLPGLRAEADRVALGALESVTITSLAGDGGSSGGTLTTDPVLYLEVIENLIAELDPENAPPPASNSAIVRFF